MALLDVHGATAPIEATVPFPATKFVAPDVHPGSIPRAGALRHLDTAAPVTIVKAWPGTGKTQLLASWVARPAVAADTSGDVAWISCDDTDADPAVLWAALLTGLGLALGDGWHGGDRLWETVPAGATPRRLAAAVVNRLVECRSPMTIVIDDAHRAGDALATLGPLIERLPTHARIMMTTTRELPIELHALRMRRLLTELDQDDLALSLDEVRSLLHQHGLRLGCDELRAINDTMEGWLAPWILLLPHLSSVDGRQHAQHAPTTERIGDLAPIADFLRDVVLLRLPERLRDFVSDLALLEEFTPEDCRDVLGHGADVLLGECRERGVLVVGPDERGRYRLHRLLRDLLRRDRTGGERPRDRGLHAAAAMVYAARDQPTLAIRHHVRAGDVDAALDVVAQRLRDGGVQCDESTVAGWLDEIDVRLVLDAGSSAASHAAYALALSCAGHVERGRHWLAALGHADRASDPQVRRLMLMAELLAALRAGEPEAVLSSHEALSAVRIERAEPASPLGCVAAVNAAIWLDDVQLACDHVGRYWTRAGRCTADDVLVESVSAHLLALEGDLNRSDEVARWAIRVGDELGIGDRWPLANAHLALGLVGYERGHLDEARERLSHVVGCFGARAPVTTMLAREAMAYVHLLSGGVTAARRLLSQMADEPLATSSPLNDRIAGLDVRISLEEGTVAVARERLAAVTNPWQAALLRTRVGLVAGDLDDAIEAIDSAQAPATRRATIDRCVARARIAGKARNPTATERQVRAALDLAVPQTAVGPFFEDGMDLWPTVRKVLSSYPNHQFHEAAQQVAKLSQSSQYTRAADFVGSGAMAVLGLLRNRELEVLRLLGGRYSNREIASMMYISANTLKTHTRALYRKLGIRSRDEAIALAHRFGLS